MYHAARAEQKLIARRAERAWMVAEAKDQGRFSSRPSAFSRLKMLVAGIVGRQGRDVAEATPAQQVGRRRSATAS